MLEQGFQARWIYGPGRLENRNVVCGSTASWARSGEPIDSACRIVEGDKLTVDVNEQNAGAHAFYKKYGFVQTGRSELDGAGKPYPLIHMELGRHNGLRSR